MPISQTVGVIGGSGQLGGAIARGWLRAGCVAPERLWISNRSGTVSGFEDWQGVQFTTRNQDLISVCDAVLLSVPPHLVPTLDISAGDRLMMSVMAGVSIDAIGQQTKARRIVRGMSNPAADIGLAYSPWCASSEVSDDDKRLVAVLFTACGKTDEVPDEDQIDRFTALTGPVPGFVAYFADCMVDYAVRHGIDEAVANRAIGQLFRASGTIFADLSKVPKEHVKEMIAYAGTTAAGLEAMKSSAIAKGIEDGLDAAYGKAQTIAGGE